MSFYEMKHHNIESISIHLSNGTNIDLTIYVKSSSIQVYTNHGYYLRSMPCSTNVYGIKSFQSVGDLLDELQDLGLIKCGHNIKRSSS